MERVALHGTYTLARKGVQHNMDAVKVDRFDRVFAQEGESHIRSIIALRC